MKQSPGNMGRTGIWSRRIQEKGTGEDGKASGGEESGEGHCCDISASHEDPGGRSKDIRERRGNGSVHGEG